MQRNGQAQQADYTCNTDLPLQSFTWDGFHEKVVHWQIASNQLFDEVEDPYFIDMMSYARRSIADKLLKADAMKNRVIEYSKESHIRLKNILHVNAALLIFFWEF